MKHWIHPRFTTLSRFVDGEVTKEKEAGVRDHVARCARCAKTVQFIEQIKEDASHLSLGTVPPSSKQRLFDRGSWSQAVIGAISPQPQTETNVTEPRVWPRLLGTASVLSITTAVVLLTAGEAASSHSTLSFTDTLPGAGDDVGVRYRISQRFPFEDRVALRAEVLADDSPTWADGGDVVVLDTLVRSGREYVGRFEWPANAAYVVLAVEALDGSWVDFRAGDWALLRHTARRPELAALRQRFLYAANTDDEWHAASEMVAYYPEEPMSWGMREYAAELQFGSPIPDSLKHELDSAYTALLRRAGHEKAWAIPERITALYWWALGREDSTYIDELRSRVLAVAPLSPEAMQYRAMTLATDTSRTDRETAEAFEALWETSNGRHPVVAEHAYYNAADAQDPAGIVKWGLLWADLRPSRFKGVIENLLDSPATTAAALDALERFRSDRFKSSPARPLHMTVAEFAAQRAAEQRWVSLALGRAHLALGDRDAGLEYLALSDEAGWDIKSFEAAAQAYALAGRDNKAASFAARVVLDDSISGRDTPTAVRRLLERVSEAQRAEASVDAKQRMLDEVRRDFTWKRIDDQITVTTESGTRNLRSLIDGRGAVLTFLRPDMPRTNESYLDSLSGIAARWASTDLLTAVVVLEVPGQEFTRQMAARPRLILLRDHSNEVQEFLGGRPAIPDIYVIGSDGASVFRSQSFGSIPRVLTVLEWLDERARPLVAP